MAIHDHISNLLTRIRNAQRARFDQVELPSTKVLEEIARILKEEGFVKNFRVIPDSKQAALRIYLRNTPPDGYAIQGIQRVSRPGRRVYVGKDEIPPVKSGYGISILSTSQGVMTGEKAKRLEIGGEVLCRVW